MTAGAVTATRTRVAATVVSIVVLLQSVLFLGALAWHVRLDTGVPIYGYWLESLVGGPPFILLTILLLRRRPDHRLAWMFAAVALAAGLQESTGALAHLLQALGRTGPVPHLSVLASLGQMSWLLLLLLLILHFPTGELPGRRWRPLLWLFLAGAVASMVSTLQLEEILPVGPDVVSPLAGATPAVVELLGTVGLGAGALGSVAAVIVRFRRSTGIERQQLRWFLASVVAAVAAILFIPFGALGWAVGPAMVPTGIAIAILRYRLYDLDRVVSRTVTYGLVTLVLAGVYAGIVVGVQALAGPEDAPDIVVAGATLAAAALFRPVRTRVQRVVDRRFNRSRYDADAVVGRFAERLRDELELPTVAADLRNAVARTLHPGQVGVWVRSADTRP